MRPAACVALTHALNRPVWEHNVEVVIDVIWQNRRREGDMRSHSAVLLTCSASPAVLFATNRKGPMTPCHARRCRPAVLRRIGLAYLSSGWCRPWPVLAPSSLCLHASKHARYNTGSNQSIPGLLFGTRQQGPEACSCTGVLHGPPPPTHTHTYTKSYSARWAQSTGATSTQQQVDTYQVINLVGTYVRCAPRVSMTAL